MRENAPEALSEAYIVAYHGHHGVIGLAFAQAAFHELIESLMDSLPLRRLVAKMLLRGQSVTLLRQFQVEGAYMDMMEVEDALGIDVARFVSAVHLGLIAW
jgi:hypothetical protein